MNEKALFQISQLFLIFTIMLLSTACATVFAWPVVICTTAACCLAVHRVATMGGR